MPQVFREAHIVCLPSYREGLPKALLEAAAAGRPIVATDVPGCREIVRPGQNGILVPPRSPSALADALRTMIQDAALRARLGAAGRLLVEQEFSIETVAAATVALYRRVAT
jgi:glycosyltransferase involved in cell wall biosynthesis